MPRRSTQSALRNPAFSAAGWRCGRRSSNLRHGILGPELYVERTPDLKV